MCPEEIPAGSCHVEKAEKIIYLVRGRTERQRGTSYPDSQKSKHFFNVDHIGVIRCKEYNSQEKKVAFR